MSREIKFRAYQPHSSLHRRPGMYLVDDLAWYEMDAEGHTGEAFLTRKLGTARSSEYIEDIHLMQYTGLKDKNGVEIYEGDIVVNDEGVDTYVVEWNKRWACFEFTGLTYRDIHCNRLETEGSQYNAEVIGNIYENPELLGGEVAA